VRLTLTVLLGAFALALAACAPRILTPLPSRPAARDGQSTNRSVQAEPEGATTNARLKPLDENQPAQITSDRLVYTNQGKVTVFSGQVNVRQGAMRVEAPYLEVRSDDGRAVARQGVRLTDHARGMTLTARELEYKQNLANAKARGDVRLVSHDDQGQSLRVRSDRLDWDNDRREALARGRVQITYRDTTATADVMTYRQAEQLVILAADGESKTRRPQIEQAGNTILGNLITLRLRERVYEVQGEARAEIQPRETSGAPASGRKEKP